MSWRMEMGPFSLVALVVFIASTVACASAAVFVEPAAGLKVGFYNSTCPQAESIVRNVIRKHFESDRTVTGGLLRLFFHDCWVEGCDASILIDPTDEKESEQSAQDSFSIRGYDVIADVKTNLEAVCPSTVSCADVLALATRDSVVMAGGLYYPVPTGRRDSRVSDPNNVDIPAIMAPAANVAMRFAKHLNFTIEETVAIFGAHSVGIHHCDGLWQRLWDMFDLSKGIPGLDGPFPSTGKPDPTMDPALRKKLRAFCGKRPVFGLDKDKRVFLDLKTPYTMDNAYYQNILEHQGIAIIDQSFGENPITREYVSMFASNETLFLNRFAEVMFKLGNFRVLVGNAGEIRNKCNAFN